MDDLQARDPRPRSAVSHGVGLAGLFGLGLWLAVARSFDAQSPASALVALAACGVPMVLWSLVVDRVHRNPTTGIDWSAPPFPWRETFDISLVKLGGLWATWGLIAVVYSVGRWYATGNYGFAMDLFRWAAVPLVLVSIPYVAWLDRRLVKPRDNAWHFGQMLIGGGGVERERIHEHLRQWAVKGFFLAFMVSIVPGNWAHAVAWPAAEIAQSPVNLARWLIAIMFAVDVCFATVGYMLTMKPLDAHIRSANPHAAGWTAALICYPPFALMYPGGPLDYQHQELAWTHWLHWWPSLLPFWGALLFLLTGVYAWATVAFGLRFSNLTHRGILTHGPYAFTKHPAYLSKTLFWWAAAMPFIPVSGSLADAARNSAILAAVTGVYYWRARTEERHLGADPAYREYAEWMARNGPVSRMLDRLTGKRGRAPVPVPAE